MPELVFLGAQVGSRMTASTRAAGNALDHANSGALQLVNFVGIIREQSNRTNAKRFQRLGGKFVVTSVVGEAEAAVGFHGIETGILQFVCLQLVNQSDSAALLRQVQQYTGRLFGDLTQREFQLRAAVAALRGKNVPGKALRMDANQRRFAAIRGSALRSVQLAVLNRDGFFSRFASFDAKNSKSAKAGGQLRLRDHASFARLPGFFMRLH